MEKSISDRFSSLESENEAGLFLAYEHRGATASHAFQAPISFKMVSGDVIWNSVFSKIWNFKKKKLNKKSGFENGVVQLGLAGEVF